MAAHPIPDGPPGTDPPGLVRDAATTDAGTGVPGDSHPPSSTPAAVGPPALSVAGAARGLGVAPATLRSWERRYGLAPSLHTAGGHRRYGPADLARLQVMHRLVRDGVPPAEAAKVAIAAETPEAPAPDGPYAALLAGPNEAGADTAVPPSGAAGEVGAPSGGGRVLRMPRTTRSARGLARAAMALDSHSCRRTIEASLADQGALRTWEELVRPVLVAVGEKWAETGRGIEVEHSFSVVAGAALAGHASRLTRPRNDRPVLLASAPAELHDLPLLALQAALADEGIRSHVTGARTPSEALAEAILRLGPPVVFLWAQMPTQELPELPSLRPAPLLLLGGPGWPQEPEGTARISDLADAVGAVRVAMGV